MSRPRYDTGGPAFPHLDQHGSIPGMSLRDYFAAAALQGLLSGPPADPLVGRGLAGGPGPGGLPRYSYPDGADFAREAYGLADAMLDARDRPAVVPRPPRAYDLGGEGGDS